MPTPNASRGSDREIRGRSAAKGRKQAHFVEPDIVAPRKTVTFAKKRGGHCMARGGLKAHWRSHVLVTVTAAAALMTVFERLVWLGFP